MVRAGATAAACVAAIAAACASDASATRLSLRWRFPRAWRTTSALMRPALLVSLLAALVTLTAALAPASHAQVGRSTERATAARVCNPPRGISRLRATNVRCATARIVARRARNGNKHPRVHGRTWTCHFHRNFTANCRTGGGRRVWMEIFDGPAKPTAAGAPAAAGRPAL